MKKKSSFSTQGQRADMGELIINRMLPNRYADAVGPFVFLDHIVPGFQSRVQTEGTGAHPHRGIATLTYMLTGESEHLDSAGNYAKVHSGGIQWMNAGNGIIHDEILNPDSRTDSSLVHAFQFWINLPSAVKARQPAYLALESHQVPVKTFGNASGWIRVLMGSFDELDSPIPNPSEAFLYHIHLNTGADFTLNFAEQTEVAAFLPTRAGTFNDEPFDAGDFVEFDREAGSITCFNENAEASDYLLFGGTTYQEPIAAEGPFVMNSRLEIANAYRDYYNGDYGTIDYEKRKSTP